MFYYDIFTYICCIQTLKLKIMLDSARDNQLNNYLTSIHFELSDDETRLEELKWMCEKALLRANDYKDRIDNPCENRFLFESKFEAEEKHQCMTDVFYRLESYYEARMEIHFGKHWAEESTFEPNIDGVLN